MSSHWQRAARIACGIGLGALGVALMPAACLYPDFTFNETEPAVGGGGGSPMSSASTTMSSGGGMGGTGGEMSGTGGASSSEDCLNGTDDDDDGAVDCADSDCGAITTCTPKVPFGWSGFAALFEGVPEQAPECPAAFPSPNPYEGYKTPVAATPTCTACSCGAPEDQECEPPKKITLHNKSCGMQGAGAGSLDQPDNWDGTCWGPDGYAGGSTSCGGPCNVSVSTLAPTVSGGSCSPSGGDPTVPPLSWAIAGKACGDPAVGGGCGAGQVCQPKPPLPFLSGLCIQATGDLSCPAETFTQKHLLYGDATDTRGCETCACGAPSGSTCTISISVFSDSTVDTCTTQVATFNAGGCGNLSNNPAVAGRKATVTAPPSGGSCAPSGGKPSGSVTPTEPTTFCCAP